MTHSGLKISVPARPQHTPNWQAKALCADDHQPDRWVDLPPVRVRGKNNPDYDTHVADLSETCAVCPVRDHCLWAALDMNVRGVFAGTDEFDRADIRDDLALPTPPRFPTPENDEDARLIEQQFTALRLARKGYSNTEIATELGVSAMTVSRLTASEEKPAERRGKKAFQEFLDETAQNAQSAEPSSPLSADHLAVAEDPAGARPDNYVVVAADDHLPSEPQAIASEEFYFPSAVG